MVNLIDCCRDRGESCRKWSVFRDSSTRSLRSAEGVTAASPGSRRPGVATIADVEAIMADLVSRTPAVIERVGVAIPKNLPAAIADRILAGVNASSEFNPGARPL